MSKSELDLTAQLASVDVYYWQEANRCWSPTLYALPVQSMYLHLAGVKPLDNSQLQSIVKTLPTELLTRS